MLGSLLYLHLYNDATSLHVVTCFCVDKRLHLLLTTWMMCKHSDGLC